MLPSPKTIPQVGSGRFIQVDKRGKVARKSEEIRQWKVTVKGVKSTYIWFVLMSNSNNSPGQEHVCGALDIIVLL